MIISLVVTGLENTQHIDRMLNSVINSNFNFKIQIIFINQDNYCDTKKYIFPGHIEFIEISSPRISLSKARNLGLSKCSGEIIGFPDDDCWYSRSLLNEIYSIFQKNENLKAICTNVFDPDLGRSYGNRPFETIKINYYNLFKLPISVGIFISKKIK